MRTPGSMPATAAMAPSTWASVTVFGLTVRSSAIT